MKLKLHTSILAAAVASLISVPAWSAGTEQEPLGSGDPVQQIAPDSGEPDAAVPAPDDLQMGQEAPRTSPEPQMGQDDPQLATGDNPIYELTPNELRRMEVVNPLGEKVGDIDAVVQSKDSTEIQAVISAGGVLGIGATEVAVPIDELELSADKLLLGETREGLEARGAYEPDAYVELEPGNKPISEFSAFELVPEESPDAPMNQPQEGVPEPMEQPQEGMQDPAQESMDPPAEAPIEPDSQY